METIQKKKKWNNDLFFNQCGNLDYCINFFKFYSNISQTFAKRCKGIGILLTVTPHLGGLGMKHGVKSFFGHAAVYTKV